MKHGVEDAKECFARIDQSQRACTRQCAAQCKDGGEQCSSCMEKCERPASCERGKRCEELDKSLLF
jgi:hypothetical protein